MAFFKHMTDKVAGKGIRMVFPEANDARVLGAAARLKADNLMEPILLGNRAEVEALAQEMGINNLDEMTLIDLDEYPAEGFEAMVQAFVECRNGRNTEEQGREMLKDVNYFGTMLVQMDLAEGLVSGVVHSTGDTVRPALQIIKTRPGVSRTSGAFVMIPEDPEDQMLLFADCAINISPSAQELAEITESSIETAEVFGIDPKVAMLSFSTKGSGGNTPEVKKMVEATRLAKELSPEYADIIDGELQFDTAFSEVVGKQKAPESPVAGQATVYIFPDLQSGNIGYKIAQRLGGYEAIGPVLQGLNKPISDLSRGAVEEDVYRVALITATQALNEH